MRPLACTRVAALRVHGARAAGRPCLAAAVWRRPARVRATVRARGRASCLPAALALRLPRARLQRRAPCAPGIFLHRIKQFTIFIHCRAFFGANDSINYSLGYVQAKNQAQQAYALAETAINNLENEK